MTTEGRINHYLVPELEDSELRATGRTALQDVLERKAAAGCHSALWLTFDGIFGTFSALPLLTDLLSETRLSYCLLRKPPGAA